MLKIHTKTAIAIYILTCDFSLGFSSSSLRQMCSIFEVRDFSHYVRARALFPILKEA